MTRSYFQALLISFFFLLSSCGGSGGGGNSSGGDSIVPAAILGANKGQALLGPIVDATISVYEAENFNGIPVCTVTTSSEGAPDGPGVADFSSCPTVPGAIYFLVVRGGMDIDVDDDQILDSAPTPKNGAMRALITGDDIAKGNFRINILTEIAYQSVTDALLTGEAGLEIMNRLDNVADQLLKGDLNNDGAVDNADLLSFSPLFNSESISGENSELLKKILAAIHSGNSSDLTKLSRQYLLASLGEFNYAEFLDPNVPYKNFVITDFLTENGYLYAAGFEADSSENAIKILIIDVQDFGNVRLAGEVSLKNLPVRSGVRQMIKVGDYLYLISTAGLIVADVSDPSLPTASLHIAGEHFHAITEGGNNNFYVSSVGNFNVEPSVKSLSIFDITNPSSPSIQTTIHDHAVFSMVYHDGYLYTYGSGISVFNARSPGNLTLLDNLPFPSVSGRNLVYANGFVYLPTDDVTGLLGISTFDVTDPTDIKRSESLTSGGGFITKLATDGNLLFVGESLKHNSAALTTFKIKSNGGLKLIDSRSASQRFDLHVENERIYLSGPTGFIAYDVNSLHNRSSHLDFIATPNIASHVEVVGNVAFVADTHSLLAIDVSSPGNGLKVIAQIRASGIEILDLRIVGNHAYVADSDSGLNIIDISDPRNMVVVGRLCSDGGRELDCSRAVNAVAVQGDYAYTYTEGGLLSKFLISEPATPALIAENDSITTMMTDLAIKGKHLYAVNRNKLYVINADSLALSSAQSLLAKTIEISGDYAYTSSNNSGLSILNVANSANPVLFGGQLGLGIGNAVSISGNTAYVANEFGLIEIYDVSDKTNPELLFVHQINGTVRDIFATDDYIYAVNGFGLVVEPAVKLQNVFD